MKKPEDLKGLKIRTIQTPTYTDKERAVIQEGAIMARDVQRSLAPLREAEAFEFLKGKGMVITTVTPSSRPWSP